MQTTTTPNATRRAVIHVGPSAEACGGIASVLRVLRDARWPDDLDVSHIETTAASGGLASLVRGLSAPLRVAAECRRHPGAVVHVHTASRGSFLRKYACLEVARRCGAQTVLHVHGAQFDRFAATPVPAVRTSVIHALNAADAVIALSPEWEQRLHDIAGREDIEVVDNPVRVPPVPASATGYPRVVFLGRVSERKGAPELFEAIRLLQERGVAAYWVLAGDGDVDAARRIAATLPNPEMVSVPGWLDAEQTARLLGSSAAFCLPSHDEGKPVALLEAMAVGLACVATPVGGIPDVVRDGENGILVPAGDAEALAAALERVVTDSALRRQLGERARADVSERYSIERVVDRLSSIYAGLGSDLR